MSLCFLLSACHPHPKCSSFVNQGLDPIDGVIGADVLLRLDAIIDFRKMTLQIFPPDE